MNTAKLSQLIVRLADGGSISDLGRRMGVKGGTLRAYVRNDGGYPSVETLMAIAKYMGIELDELVRSLTDKPANRLRDDSPCYRVPTCDELIGYIRDLSDTDKKKVVLHTVEAMAV
jgi:transcriptional regulator with XRE-family HTH domain